MLRYFANFHGDLKRISRRTRMSHGDTRYDVSFGEPCMEWDTYGDGGYDLCCHPEGTDINGWIEMNGLEASQSSKVRENVGKRKELDVGNLLSYANRESLSCPNVTTSTFDESHPCQDKCSSAYTLKKNYSDSQLSSASSEYMSCATDDSTEEEEAGYQKSGIPAWLENVDTIKGTRFDCPLISSVSNKNAQNFELKFPSTTVRLRIEVDPNDNIDVKNFGLEEEETAIKAQIDADVLPYEDSQLSALPSELENTEELQALLSNLDNSTVNAKKNYNISFTDTCDVSNTEEGQQHTAQIPWLHIYKSSDNIQSNIYTDNQDESELDTTSSGETMLTEVTSSENESLQLEHVEVSRFSYKGTENEPERSLKVEQKPAEDDAILAYNENEFAEDFDEISSEDSLVPNDLENYGYEQSAVYETDVTYDDLFSANFFSSQELTPGNDILTSDSFEELATGNAEKDDNMPSSSAFYETDITHDDLFSANSFSSQELTSENDINTSYSFEELSTGNTKNDENMSSTSSSSTEEFVSDDDSSSSVFFEEPLCPLAIPHGVFEQNISPVETDPIHGDQQTIGEEVYIIRREDDHTFDGLQQTKAVTDSEASLEGDIEFDIPLCKYLENGDRDDDIIPERFFASGSSLRSRAESLMSDMSSPSAQNTESHDQDDYKHQNATSFTAISDSFEIVLDESTEIVNIQVRDTESSFKPDDIIKGLAGMKHEAEKVKNEEQYLQDMIEVDILEPNFETPAAEYYQKERNSKIKFHNEFDVELQMPAKNCVVASQERARHVTFHDTIRYENPSKEKDEHLRVAQMLVANVIASSQAYILLEYWRSHNEQFQKEEKALKNDNIEDFLSIPDSDSTDTTWHEIDVNLSWSQFAQKSDGKSEASAISSEEFQSIQSFSVEVMDYSSQSSSSSPSLTDSSSSFSQDGRNGKRNVTKNLKMKYSGKGRGKPYDPLLRDTGTSKRSKEASATITQKHKRHANTRNIILQELEQLANMLSKYAVLGARRDISHEYLEAEYARQREIRLLVRYDVCRLRCDGNAGQSEDWPTRKMEEPHSSKGVMKHVNFAADVQIINPYSEKECNSVHVCQTCAMRNPARKKKTQMKAKKDKLDIEFPQQLIKCSLCNRDHQRI